MRCISCFVQFMPCLFRQLKTMLGQVTHSIAFDQESPPPSVHHPVFLSPFFCVFPILVSHDQSISMISFQFTPALSYSPFDLDFIFSQHLCLNVILPVYTCTLFILLLPILTAHSALHPAFHPWIMVTSRDMIFNTVAFPSHTSYQLSSPGGVVVHDRRGALHHLRLLPGLLLWAPPLLLYLLYFLHLLLTIDYLGYKTSQVNFYEPLLSSPSYPRSAGLAMASFHIITGVFLIFNSLLVLCTQSRWIE